MIEVTPKNAEQGYFQEVFEVFAGLLKGMAVTFRTLLRPAVTLQYPTEKLVPHRGFRGVLLYDVEKCACCGLCVDACPSSCIQTQPQPGEQGKRLKKPAWYSIDFGRCNFCRLCEEACPEDPPAIWHSLDYELVFFKRDEMVRCWKPGFPSVGKYYDRQAEAFRDPEGQIRIQTVPERPER